MQRRWQKVLGCFILEAFALGVFASVEAQPACQLEWTAVTETTTGAPIPANEIAYRVYVVPVGQAFVTGVFQMMIAGTTIPCADVGFLSGTQAAVTAVHVPSQEESVYSNVVTRSVLMPPGNLHIVYQ